MNILVVTQYFWPENFRINDLVLGLQEFGHEITILTGYPNYPAGKKFDSFTCNPGKYEIYNGIRVIRVPHFVRGRNRIRLALNYISFFLSASIIGFLRVRKDKFDLVFAYATSPIFSAIPAVYIKKKKKIPLVLWVLDLWPESLIEVGSFHNKYFIGFIRRIVTGIYQNCSLILGQSPSFVKEILRYTLESNSVRLFPNWSEEIFDTNRKIPVSNPFVKKAGYFNVTFAGNIGVAQDFSTIVDAIEITKGNTIYINWTIVGDGSRANWLRKEIAVRGLADVCEMAGPHPLEKMPIFYEQADVLLVSLLNKRTYSITIPGKLQTYMNFGKPVIAMLPGEGAELVRNAKAGRTVEAGDAVGLSNTVIEMSRLDREYLIQMGSNGQQYVQSHFNRRVLISRLNDLLDYEQRKKLGHVVDGQVP